MEESGSVRTSISSVRDDKSIYTSYDFLPSKQSNNDFFLSISSEAEVSARRLAGFEASLNRLFACRYHYRKGKAMKTMQIGKLKV